MSHGATCHTGTITTHLLGVDARLAANPRPQLVSVTQCNIAVRQLSLNARIVWEYRPLAFVTQVYNDRSPVSGLDLTCPPPVSRQLIAKFSWLFQMQGSCGCDDVKRWREGNVPWDHGVAVR